MEYLPLFFDIKGQRCLLVGGGSVACRKARLLLRAGASLTVVAPDITQELTQLLAEYEGEHRCRPYRAEDLDGCRLVIAATDDHNLNRRVSADAKARQLPVNVVDNPDLCTFITPAIIDRAPLTIAISSGGQAPVLARQLRARIESLVPAAYGQLAQLAARFRDRVKKAFRDPDQRRHFWEDAFEGQAAEKALGGDMAAAEQVLEQQLAQPTPIKQGEVYLVGGGPGDPDLLTFRALRLMQKADVVLYDRLVSEGVMELVRRDADRIYVGKRRSQHAVPQGEINQLLVDLAKQGKRVLRLKGGDPFIFGRGGEEIELLAQHGIPFQVVPGITAASGCAAYAGIPLTHRDHAQSVRFITGHLQDDSINLHWPELLEPSQTLVFYMGLKGLSVICRALIEHGRDADTPAALVEKGTTREQRVFTGTLSNLPGIVENSDVHAPTLLIIGDVVKLHPKLKWFGQ